MSHAYAVLCIVSAFACDKTQEGLADDAGASRQTDAGPGGADATADARADTDSAATPGQDSGPESSTDAASSAKDSGASGATYGTGGTRTAEYVSVTGGGTRPSATGGVTASCPGDCSTDATSCLQSAADSAHGQGKPLVIPPPSGACYLISQRIHVSGSIIGVGYPLIKVAGATGDSKQSALSVSYSGSGMWITGLRIDGGFDTTGQSSASGEWSAGIELYDSSNITIEDNQIQNTVGDSIYLGSNSSGEANILINANDLVNPYRCNTAFIHTRGVVMSNNKLVKRNWYVTGIDFEPNDPPNEQVLDVELVGNDTSVPNGLSSTGCAQTCTDFMVGASCSPNQGSPHGGSLFIHDNTTAGYMAANVTEGDGPGFSENNSSEWSGSCSGEWQEGSNAHGAGFYVWNNPPGSGTTNGNAPP